MKSIGIILEYLGPIHVLRRWSQELIAYEFLPAHRPGFMMRDVDALNRGTYHKVVNSYSAMTYTLYEQDTREYPSTYSASILKTLMKSGKYTLKSSTMAAPARASETDVVINLVNCCHLLSTQVSDACSMVTSCVSAPSMIGCNKSSIYIMVNCTKSGNDSASASSMIDCN